MGGASWRAVGLEQWPVAVLQVPATWDWSEAVQTTGLLPVQSPLWQVSVWVQALPSLHAVPLLAFGLEHWPVAVLQVPATWHWSEAVQTTGLLPVQSPLWQVSVWVQALPSLHAVPLLATATDRKSTRLNSSHRCISYAVFCLKKKKK